MKILSFGSMNLDNVYRVPHTVRPGETLSSLDMEVFVGGKGLNQSIAMSRAGLSVFHAGLVGEDGEPLLDALRESGVDVSFVQKIPGKSGHTVIQVEDGGQNAILLYGGSNRRLALGQIDETFAHFSPGDCLVLQNEVNCLPELIAKGAERGFFIALNPSPYNEIIDQCDLSAVSLLLINEIEGAGISGKEKPVEILDGLLSRYPETKIVLTMGAEGAYYRDSGQTLFQGAFPVKAVDTTAAGDTFTGYFLQGLLAGLPLAETLRRGAMAAALAVSRKGASPSIPCREEVEGALREV